MSAWWITPGESGGGGEEEEKTRKEEEAINTYSEKVLLILPLLSVARFILFCALIPGILD